jgi:hypothetical protein
MKQLSVSSNYILLGQLLGHRLVPNTTIQQKQTQVGCPHETDLLATVDTEPETLPIYILTTRSITVAERSKARTVFARSNTGIVGSNPTRGMDVCVRLFCLCCSVCR